MLTGDVLDGRFESLDAAEYDLPGVDRLNGRDTRLDTPVYLDTVTSVAPTAVRRAALRAMSVRDPRLARIVAVQGGGASAPTTIVSEPLPGAWKAIHRPGWSRRPASPHPDPENRRSDGLSANRAR